MKMNGKTVLMSLMFLSSLSENQAGADKVFCTGTGCACQNVPEGNLPADLEDIECDPVKCVCPATSAGLECLAKDGCKCNLDVGDGSCPDGYEKDDLVTDCPSGDEDITHCCCPAQALPCSPNPCQNHGICITDENAPDGFRCSCPRGFRGRYCEQRCHCLNGGECHWGKCVCPHGYYGKRCDIKH